MLIKEKMLLMVSISTLLVFGFSLAQNTIVDSSSGTDKIVELSLTGKSIQKSINDVNQIKVYFCNWEELSDSLFINVVPGQEKDLCLRFENSNDNKILFASEFYETSITASGYPVCNSTNPVNLFTRSISNNRENTTKVPPKSYVQKILKLKFPIWYSWLYHFCHYYRVDWWWSSVPMFNIVVHKQNFMDVFVNSENMKLTWQVDISNFIRNKEEISFSVKNTFPFDQEISFSAVISNVFWFKKELILTWDTVWYNTTRNFVVNISDLPYYKWLFNLSLKINYIPRFEFDAKNSGIDPAILDWWETNWKTNFFIFDKSQVMMIGFLILIIFLIKMAFFTKPKIVYIEQNNQNKK